MFRHCLAIGLILVGSASLKADFEGVLNERLHDFGVVPRGQQLVHYFRISNPTAKSLRISNVRVSCGCTSARALETTVAPGGETAIYAVMDSRRFVGSKAVTIYVSFDQPRSEELRAVVQAFSREDLIFSSDAINFGKVRQGLSKTASMNVTIYNGSVRVLEARAESSFVQPSVKEIRRTAGETTYQVEAVLRPNTPVGLWFTDIWLTTNNPAYPKLRVPLTVEVDALQPAQGEEKKVEATKTSRAVDGDDWTFPRQTEEPPYQTAPLVVQPVVERTSIFPIFSIFRR